MKTDVLKLYVDFDTLFDTRMGALMVLKGDDIVAEATKKGYLKRLTDVWSHIGLDVNQEEYEKVYADRGVEVLRKSILTPMVHAVSVMGKKLMDNLYKQPFYKSVEIDINVYPFQMTDSVKMTLLKGLLTYFPVDNLFLNIVYFPTSDLTLDRIKTEYTDLVIYHWDKWLACHGMSLSTVSSPKTQIVIPALYFKGVIPTADDLKQTAIDFGIREASHDTHFAANEMMLVEKFQLITIDVNNFSFASLEK
jgi:hypothetical protein